MQEVRKTRGARKLLLTLSICVSGSLLSMGWSKHFSGKLVAGPARKREQTYQYVVMSVTGSSYKLQH